MLEVRNGDNIVNERWTPDGARHAFHCARLRIPGASDQSSGGAGDGYFDW